MFTPAAHMIVDGDDARGYAIYDGSTGERVVSQGSYVQRFAYREDAEAFIATRA